jgi:signal transduction histidine kinase
MKQLLEEVLVLGEIESNKLQCHPAPLNLAEFCRGLIKEVESTTGYSHIIHFSENTPAPSDAPTEADEKLLRYILTNLLFNAVKYSPLPAKAADNSDRPITLSLTYQPTSLTFCVTDQGIGIPLEDQAHLFESFHRGSNVNHIPGTGLGLNIVKQCVDAYKGEISVSSQIAGGTTFTVIIPY